MDARKIAEFAVAADELAEEQNREIQRLRKAASVSPDDANALVDRAVALGVPCDESLIKEAGTANGLARLLATTLAHLEKTATQESVFVEQPPVTVHGREGELLPSERVFVERVRSLGVR